jgi:hypothetical protein
MNNLNPRGNLPGANLPGANLSGATEPAESETARLVARARVMMIISALTTLLAIAAVVTVIGYRVYGGGGVGPATEDIVTLPKGGRVVSMAASAGRLAVMVDVNGSTELRVFDLKTMKEIVHLHFATEP